MVESLLLKRRAIWRGAVKAEAARGSGKVAAGVLWDMQSFYETIDLERLRARGEDLGFNAVIMKVALNAYKAARHFFHQGLVLEATFAIRGMPAGDQFATTFVKVYCLRSADALVCRNPKVEFEEFIDDLQVACSGRASEVVQTLKQAVGDLESFVLDDLGADIAYDKAAITATKKGLADSLRSALGRLAGKSSTHAVNLGIDDTSGRGRHQLKNTKRRSR